MSIVETFPRSTTICKPENPTAIRLGVVSFLNTLPLIDGLEDLSDLELVHAVPSHLIDMLQGGQVDVALCSSIDYQRAKEPLAIVPCGLLGSDGPTLTVRLFSRVPFDRLQRVHCDTDSHTSIALLSILLRERWQVNPELASFSSSDRNLAPDHQAILLIGDKVIANAPPTDDYPHQLDLGESWTKHTGLPFVFACWMTPAAPGIPITTSGKALGTDTGKNQNQRRIHTLARILDHQRCHNRERIDGMIHRHAPQCPWTMSLASSYLKEHIVYDWTPERRAGLECFFEKAHTYGLIEQNRPLVFLDL